MKPKFIYQSYDYSFLQPKASVWWHTYMPQAVQVVAQTIGFDMATVEPMNEPVGQLFYFEPTVTATTLSDKISEVSNTIWQNSLRGNNNYIVTNSTVSEAINNAITSQVTKYMAKEKNFFKKIN